jgi:hypothetical protein
MMKTGIHIEGMGIFDTEIKAQNNISTSPSNITLMKTADFDIQTGTGSSSGVHYCTLRSLTLHGNAQWNGGAAATSVGHVIQKYGAAW